MPPTAADHELHPVYGKSTTTAFSAHIAIVRAPLNWSGKEAVAEDEAASEDDTQSLIEVPMDLVPEVRELITRRLAS